MVAFAFARRAYSADSVCNVTSHYLCNPFQSLDSTNLCDKTLENGKQVWPPNVRCCRLTVEQEVFCRSCYGKAFGPKGYGFGGGAGTLQMTGV
jgi:hypothetical protein